MKERAIPLVLLLMICLSGCGKNAPKPAVAELNTPQPAVTEQNAGIRQDTAALAEDDPPHIEDVYSPAGNNEFTRDLIGYLLTKVDKAHGFVHGLGLSTLITGETEELGGSGACLLVFLGNERDDQFVREIHYAISEDGVIYEYDPIFDVWNCVFSP